MKPDRRDKASKARVNYLEFTEYPDRWEEIAGVFSREAILKGSFDKYVESKRKQRGPRRDPFLCGLLNSSLAFLYFRATCAGLEGKNETYLRFFGQYLEGFSVCVVSGTGRGAALRNEVQDAVERATSLRMELRAGRTQQDRAVVERQIAAVDRQIDLLVYELYGLTDKEIRIVEEATKR